MDNNKYLAKFPNFYTFFDGRRDAPPITNRGVKIPSSYRDTYACGDKSFSVFDWYQATLDYPIDDVVRVFLDPDNSAFISEALSLDGLLSQRSFRECRPRDGHYQVGYDVIVGGETICHIMTGQVMTKKLINPATGEDLGKKTEDFDRSHIIISGYYARYLSFIIRDLFPYHRPSRVDVCIDVIYPKAFKEVTSCLRYVHSTSKRCLSDYRFQTQGDWVHNEGRTLGYPVSKVVRDEMKGKKRKAPPAFLRIYEKGYERLSLGSDLGYVPNLNWVRAELVVRPKKQARQIASVASPDSFWTATKWSERFFRMYTKKHFQAIPDDQLEINLRAQKKPSSVDSAFTHMLTQYTKTLQAKAQTTSVNEVVEAVLSVTCPESDVNPATGMPYDFDRSLSSFAGFSFGDD